MKKKHWKLVILSGILYFFCQICRTDLSACMVDLLPDLGIAKDAIGLAITAGYIAYAVGMSINSLLTDRTNPRLMICAAKCQTGRCCDRHGCPPATQGQFRGNDQKAAQGTGVLEKRNNAQGTFCLLYTSDAADE